MTRAWTLGLGLIACAPGDEGPPEPPPEPAAALAEASPPRAAPPAEDPPPARAAAPAVFQPAGASSPGCRVRVLALLSAEQYRGAGPMTPALEAQLSADPEFARMWNEESHGDQYIECQYAVDVNGKRYGWRHIISNTLDDHGTGECAGLAKEIAESITAVTHQCTDLHRGAYWGSDLVPR